MARSCGAALCDWFLSYNSVRIVVMNNPKLGIVNRLVQAIVLGYSIYALLDGRSYMHTETPLGAQDVFGEVEVAPLPTVPNYCDNSAFSYYFSEFWNYDDIGCRYMVPQELLIPGTGELFVVTAVEEKQILRHSCTATTCQTAVNTTNYFTLDPDNSVYVSCHHSYKTSWGDIGFDIAADLVDIHGNVIGSVSSGDPIRFLLRDILKAAGVSSLNNRATFGGNSTSTVNPRYRLIGINIGVYLEYSNVKDGWFDHDVKLRVLPFNRENGWAQIIRPPQYLGGDQNRMLSLTEQGARITFEVTGTVGRFDFAAFISWLVNTVVLLGVSRFVADIVAFNLLGKDSEVYRRRKVENADGFHPADFQARPASTTSKQGADVQMVTRRRNNADKQTQDASDVAILNPAARV